jgi:hypothetical protein
MTARYIVTTYQCPPNPPGARVNAVRFVYPLPEAMVGRQAIPLPVGFVAGCALTIGLLAVFHVRRRSDEIGDASEDREARLPA